MATFNAVNASGPIRFDLFSVQSLLAGSTTANTPVTFTRAVNADNMTTFTGTGFAYAGGLFNSGTITDISSVANGQTQFTIAGLALPVVQFRGFVSANNSQGFLAAIFAGDDTLTGSAFADHLRGYAGDDLILNNPGNDDDDTLDGGLGADSMDGADGDDLYIVDNASDTTTDSSGFDTVKSSVSYTIGGGVERLILTGKGDLNGSGDLLDNQIFGTAGANQLAGIDGNDLLDGGAGNDSLHGGDHNDTLLGGAGIDSMTGGDGDDLFIVDNAKDTVSDSSGIDSVQSTVSYVLSGDIDNLFLIGAGALSGTGNLLANQITGTIGANKLLGLEGNDTLEGGGGNDSLDGGLGDDVLRGGAGNDTYFVEGSNDQAVESAPGKVGGIDIVFTTGSFVLGANVENLTLIGSNSLVALGNDLNNVITAKNDNPGVNQLSGGNGNDTIIGGAGQDVLLGGASADNLIGGGGDDRYTVDDMDKIVETLSQSKGGGTDVVGYEGAIGYTLGNNLENLELQNPAGATFGNGNSLDNTITGNANANTLDGRAGADVLFGLDGDDVYVVDNVLDKVDESFTTVNPGIDTVRSSVDFDLGGPAVTGPIENLVLTGKAVTGTGNVLDNKITGNAGKNSLSGDGGNDTLDGGAGGDTLVGGEDGDVYMVDSKLDTIIDKGTVGVDVILTSKISIDISTLLDIENVQLSGKLALNVTGNNAANSLSGNEGANKLSGLTGADNLAGGKGNDTLDGGTGEDTMIGAEGNDTYLVDSFFGDTLNGDQVIEGADNGIDTIISTAPGFILFDNVENLTLAAGSGDAQGTGNSLANLVTGNEGDNIMKGEAGNDTILGGAGGDTLTGGDNNDSIDGGIGNDAIAGGSGNDTITGGAGDDTLSGESGDDLINVTAGNDVVALGLTTTDGHDLVIGFDGNAAGGQDVLSLEALFAAIPPADRAAHVQIIDHGATVDVRVDADNNLANGYELTATLQTKDAVTIGEDVLVG